MGDATGPKKKDKNKDRQRPVFGSGGGNSYTPVGMGGAQGGGRNYLADFWNYINSPAANAGNQGYGVSQPNPYALIGAATDYGNLFGGVPTTGPANSALPFGTPMNPAGGNAYQNAQYAALYAQGGMPRLVYTPPTTQTSLAAANRNQPMGLTDQGGKGKGDPTTPAAGGASKYWDPNTYGQGGLWQKYFDAREAAGYSMKDGWYNRNGYQGSLGNAQADGISGGNAYYYSEGYGTGAGSGYLTSGGKRHGFGQLAGAGSYQNAAGRVKAIIDQEAAKMGMTPEQYLNYKRDTHVSESRNAGKFKMPYHNPNTYKKGGGGNKTNITKDMPGRPGPIQQTAQLNV